MSTKVSVILPVYNVEQYLDECLQSLTAQNYDNYEVIAVNDASSDNSLVILEKWQKKDAHIKIINLKQNGGLSNARNQGIKRATGEYILFVDSDDWVRLNFISKMVLTLEKNNVDAVKCNFVFANKSIFYPNDDQYHNVPLITGEKYLKLYLQNKIYYNMSQLFITKHRIWSKIQFSVGKISEDEIIIPSMMRQLRSITIIPDILYFYRYNPSSITHQMTIKNQLDRIEAIIEMKKNTDRIYPQMYDLVNYKTLAEYFTILSDAGEAGLNVLPLKQLINQNLKSINPKDKKSKLFKLYLRLFSKYNDGKVFLLLRKVMKIWNKVKKSHSF